MKLVAQGQLTTEVKVIWIWPCYLYLELTVQLITA